MIGCCFYISLCSLWIKNSFLIIFIIECITPYKKRIYSEDFSDLSCEQWKWRCHFYQACYSFTVGPHSSVHYHPKKIWPFYTSSNLPAVVIVMKYKVMLGWISIFTTSFIIPIVAFQINYYMFCYGLHTSVILSVLLFWFFRMVAVSLIILWRNCFKTCKTICSNIHILRSPNMVLVLSVCFFNVAECNSFGLRSHMYGDTTGVP
jgi:hypothetical protein